MSAGPDGDLTRGAPDPGSRVVVIGAAGFIGSATVQEFLGAGYDVLGIDCFTAYYDRARKERNVAEIDSPRFEFVEATLTRDNAADLLAGASAVIHLAAQPGVRRSWENFQTYVDNNIVLTHAVLEAAALLGIERVVYASSSSIYGMDAPIPTFETTCAHPASAYGMSKAAGELLCEVAARQFGLCTVSMRYFTVYGPRQRPDMAIGRVIAAGVDGDVFTMFGDGKQIRDFTYVRDVARANRLAAESPHVAPGTAVNIAGGSSISLLEVIDAVGDVLGHEVEVRVEDAAAGDVLATGADTTLARELLGWTPEVDLHTGLREHIAWYRSMKEGCS